MSVILALGYFSAVYFFWTAIQEFRLAAVWPQETIAYSASSPALASSESVRAWPMPSAVAWLTNSSRTELGASVSDVMTLMPLLLASARIGAIESGSFGATTSTSTCCWMSDFTISVWAPGSAVVGPL